MSHTESYYIVTCNHKTRSITERKQSVIIYKLHGQSPFYQGFHFKRQMLSQPSASGLAPEWRAAVPSYATDTAAAHTRPPALWWCWCCLAHGHLRGCDAATFCTQIISSNGGHSKMIQNGNFHGEIMMIKKGIFHTVPYVQRRCRILRSLSNLRVHGPQGNTRYGMNQVLFDGWSFAFPTKYECINFRYGRMGWSDWTWCNIPTSASTSRSF